LVPEQQHNMAALAATRYFFRVDIGGIAVKIKCGGRRTVSLGIMSGTKCGMKRGRFELPSVSMPVYWTWVGHDDWPQS
jgi:hypothetical protein